MRRANRWTTVWSAAAVSSAVGVAGCEAVESVTKPAIASGPVATFRSEPDIRVRVRGAVESAKIEGPARFVVRPLDGGRAEIVIAPLVVSSNAGSLRVGFGKGEQRVYSQGVGVEIVPGTPEAIAAPSSAGSDAKKAPVTQAGAGVTPAAAHFEAGQVFKLDGTSYPGFAVVSPAAGESGTKFDVIAVMPIESYLPGVVTREMFKDWPREAYAAQAVASRTYALHERERSRTSGRAYDLESGEQDQVFGGVNTNPVIAQAVSETRGMILTDRGHVLRAYYSSTCGGRPASAADVWPIGPGYEFNTAAPIQGKKRQWYCQPARLYRTEVKRTDSELSARIRNWGRANKHSVVNIGRLREVKVYKTNDAGRPNSYTVRDDNGKTFTMTAEELRFACNASAAGHPEVTGTTRVNSGDMEVEVWADQVTIRCRGWGHGVGMCQWCAKGMADEQQDWRSMMKVFYPGAEVVKGY